VVLIPEVQVTQDLITLGNNGFSLQLNCYPQTNPQATYRGKPLNWFQYVIAVVNNSVEWGIQYWSAVKGFGFSPSPNYVSFGAATSNQVPAGSVMKIALETDHNGTVTKAKFSITDSERKVSSYTCKFTSASGFLTYSVSSGTLAVQTTNTCGGSQPGTGETSNVVYFPVLPNIPANPVGQEFGLPVHSPPPPKL
jgi:hypothetical protein